MTDTLYIVKTIRDTVLVKGTETLDLVTKVDSMYTGAWNRLLVFGGLIMAVSTIAIPWYLGYLRKKQRLSDRKADIAFYEHRLLEMRAELNNDFGIRITKELEDYNVEVEKAISGAKAAHFYLLGDSAIAKKDYQNAFVNFITAINKALEAEDLGNVKAILIRTTEHCIPGLTIEALLAIQNVYNFKIDEVLDAVGSADKDRLMFDTILKFKTAIAKLSQ